MRGAGVGLSVAAVTAVVIWLVTGGQLNGLPFFPGAAFSDAVTTHLPAAQYLADSITERGEFPNWRPTLMGGQPFAANPLNKTAYPFQWLTVFIPPGPFLVLMIALHSLIGGLGMWMWLRARGRSSAALMLGTIAYCASPRLIAQLGMGHLDLWYALAWLPWLMLSGHALLTAERVTIRAVGRAALTCALLIAADIRAALFALILFAAYSAYTAIGARSPMRLWRMIPVIGLAALTTSAITLPLLGWMPYLSRTQLTPAQAGELSLQPSGLLGVVLPAHIGTAETAAYVGLPLLVLAIYGALAERRWFWASAIAAAIGYSLGPSGGLWSIMTEIVPPLQWFRVPGRAWLIVAFVIPMLAADGLDHLTGRTRRRLSRQALIAGGLFTLLCVGIGLIALNSPTLPPLMGLTALVAGPAAVALVALRALGRLSTALFSACAIALVAADLMLFAHARLEWRTPEAWADPYVPLANRLLELEPDRVFSPTYSVPQQIAEYDYLRLFGGVDPFQIAAVSAEIERAAGISDDLTAYSVVQPPLVGMQGEELATANRTLQPDIDVLTRWNVSHVVSAYDLDIPGLTFVDRVGETWIYRNDAYRQRPSDDVTGWPTDFDGPPSSTTVRELNERTSAATVVSAIGLCICALAAFFPSVRSDREAASC